MSDSTSLITGEDKQPKADEKLIKLILYSFNLALALGTAINYGSQAYTEAENDTSRIIVFVSSTLVTNIPLNWKFALEYYPKCITTLKIQKNNLLNNPVKGLISITKLLLSLSLGMISNAPALMVHVENHTEPSRQIQTKTKTILERCTKMRLSLRGQRGIQLD